MKIEILPAGPYQTNSYLLIDSKSRSALAIDAGPGAYDLIKEELDRLDLNLEAVLLTHPHWDHLLDLYRFSDDSIPLYGGKEALRVVEDPSVQKSIAPESLVFKGCQLDHILEEGPRKIGAFSFDVYEVPGHCPGSLMFVFNSEKIAFTGDLIFDGSVGRTDLPGGNMAQLIASIQKKVYALDDETVIYPGHGSTTLVGKEKISNPFVNL